MHTKKRLLQNDNMPTTESFIKHIHAGEAILVRSSSSFATRVASVKKEFKQNSDVVCVHRAKMLIDDIRTWSETLRKSSGDGVSVKTTKVSKLGILVFDEILIPAQNILLKELEDIAPDVCIILLVHMHTVFLPTITSRVVEVFESVVSSTRSSLSQIADDTDKEIFPNMEYFKKEKNVAKRMDRMKKVIVAYDEGQISKQDIVVWVESLSKDYVKDSKGKKQTKLFVDTIILLKQPSTLVKYVLEFLVGFI